MRVIPDVINDKGGPDNDNWECDPLCESNTRKVEEVQHDRQKREASRNRKANRPAKVSGRFYIPECALEVPVFYQGQDFVSEVCACRISGRAGKDIVYASPEVCFQRLVKLVDSGSGTAVLDLAR